MLDKIKIQNLEKFSLENGDLYKGINLNENDYKSFGELYFTFIDYKAIKAWKRHKKMHMNLFVPVGNVEFVFFCDIKMEFRKEKIGEDNYKRLSVPPNTWFGFMGLSKNKSLVVNLASIPHDDKEVEKLDIINDIITYEWLSQ